MDATSASLISNAMMTTAAIGGYTTPVFSALYAKFCTKRVRKENMPNGAARRTG
jgi:hypothetical protein